eukprot:g2253.t1
MMINSSIGGRIPIWLSGALVGEFGDAYVANTTLEGGRTEQAIPEFCKIAEEGLDAFEGTQALSLIKTPKCQSAVGKVLEKLRKAARVHSSLPNPIDSPKAFDEFLEDRSKQVKALPVGDFLLWCGGWLGTNSGHAIMYLVDKTSRDTVSFVTCNTGDGVGHHPAEGDSKLSPKRATQMRHTDIPVDRIADPGWLYYLFRITATGHKDHTPQMFYDVVLPGLLGTSLCTASKRSGKDPLLVEETLQRSGTCYYRCILTATRYSLRRLGCTQDQVKQTLHIIRRSFVSRLTKDLETVFDNSKGSRRSHKCPDGLHFSTKRLSQLCADQLGYSAVKESRAGRMSPETLEDVHSEIRKVKELLLKIPTLGEEDRRVDWLAEVAMEMGTQQPSDWNPVTAITSSRGADLSRYKGRGLKETKFQLLDFATVTNASVAAQTEDGIIRILQRAQQICKQVLNDKANSRLANRQLEIASLIEHLFLTILPLPVFDAPGSSTRSWVTSSESSFECLTKLLTWFSASYSAAKETVPLEGSQAVHMLTHLALMCCMYNVVANGPGYASTFAKVLRGSYGFPAFTPAGQDVVELTGNLVTELPYMAVARAKLCEYVRQMRDATDGCNIFQFPRSDFKMTASHGCFAALESLRAELATSDRYFAKDSPHLDHMLVYRQRKGAASALQKITAWFETAKSSSSGRTKGLRPYALLRESVLRFMYAVRRRKSFVMADVFAPTDFPASDFNYEFNDKLNQVTLGVDVGKCSSSDWDKIKYPLSLADPRSYVQSHSGNMKGNGDSHDDDDDDVVGVEEDDILHETYLKSFDGNLSQEEAEQLFSYLTAPYMRIPLVLEFFAKERVGCLFDIRMQQLFLEVLFAPGKYGARQQLVPSVVRKIPCSPKVLRTPLGYFAAELERSPKIALTALCKILEDGIRLAVGDYKSSIVKVFLFLLRVASRALAWSRQMLEDEQSFDLSSTAKKDLAEYGDKIGVWVQRAHVIVESWLDEANEASDADSKEAAASFHAHLAVKVWSCVGPETFAAEDAARMIASVAFVKTWHVVGSSEIEVSYGLPDQEVFWLVERRRQLLLTYFDSAASQSQEEVLSEAIRAVSGNETISWEGGVGADRSERTPETGKVVLFKDADDMFSVDLQSCAVKYGNSTLKPVPEEICRHPDYRSFFSDVVPHCADMGAKEHYQAVHIVKDNIVLEWWRSLVGDEKRAKHTFLRMPGCPRQSGGSSVSFNGTKFGGADRLYKYGQGSPSDMPWLSSVLDPVLYAELTRQPENSKGGGAGRVKWIEFKGDDAAIADASQFVYLLQEPSSEPREVAHLLCLSENASFWRLFRVSRATQSVEVFVLDAFGRRAFPRFVFASDARMVPGAMAHRIPEIDGSKPRTHPSSSITKYAAGMLLAAPSGGNNILIKDRNEGDDALGPRLKLPFNVLNGTLPGAFEDTHAFWELQEGGDILGARQKSHRIDEKGNQVPFIDPFFNYDLHVATSSCAIIRVEEDPVTGSSIYRRMVDLHDAQMSAESAEILRSLTRLENVSHILAWTEPQKEKKRLLEEPPKVALIELPRLRARFSVQRIGSAGSAGSGSSVRLWVVDSGGKYVVSPAVEDAKVSPALLSGLSNFLVLSDSHGNVQLMVPNYPVRRPTIGICPFSVDTLPHPSIRWQSSCNARFFLYDVHPSEQFVQFSTVGSALYWAFLKLLGRDYRQAFKTIISCGTDMPLSWSERTILSFFTACVDDKHPNAHACLLKLRLVLMHSPIRDWPVCGDVGQGNDWPPFVKDYASYISKRGHVSAACLLTRLEEVRILQYMQNKRMVNGHPTLLTQASFISKSLSPDETSRIPPGLAEVWETEHNYKDYSEVAYAAEYMLPQPRALKLEFDPRCATEKCDTLTFFVDSAMKDSDSVEILQNGRWKRGSVVLKGSRRKWPRDGTLIIRGCTLYAKFVADVNGNDWGFRIKVSPVMDDSILPAPDAQERQRMNQFHMHFGAQKDGGRKFTSLCASILEGKGKRNCEEFISDTTHWIGQTEVPKEATRRGAQAGPDTVSIIDTMWNGNVKSFLYSFCTQVLCGNINLCLGGSRESSTRIVDMALRVYYHKNGLKGAQNALILLISGTASCLGSKKKISSLPSCDKSWAGQTMQVYMGSSDRAGDPDLVFYEGVLIPHAKATLSALQSTRKTQKMLGDGSAADELQGSRFVDIPQGKTAMRVPATITNYANDDLVIAPVEMGAATFTDADVAAFVGKPLSAFVDFSDFLEHISASGGSVPQKPPFDLSGHPDAETNIARQTAARIEADCKIYADKANSKKVAVLAGITPDLLQEYGRQQENAGDEGSSIQASFADAALTKLRYLRQVIESALDKDTKRMRSATEHILRVANTVSMSAAGGSRQDKLEHTLLQLSGIYPSIDMEQLISSLISTSSQADVSSFNPYLSNFESLRKATAGVVLLANRISQLRRTIGAISDVSRAIEKRIDAKKLRKEIEGLIGNLNGSRHYTRDGGRCDPRFLLFEFIFGWLLRKPQVYLVKTFMDRAAQGGKNGFGFETNSLVHQMIMGAGKTTCIGPLLALMLADGKSLVTQVVPNALLTMSRNVMWKSFCQLIVKPVYTLTFNRSWPAVPEVYRSMKSKMMLARYSGGIVVTTPSAIKSIVNKYVELLNTVKEAPPPEESSTGGSNKDDGPGAREKAKREEVARLAETADAIAEVINMWSEREKGVLLLDEVDMLLHPLRSELNFPIGEKLPLLPSPQRWDLPIHLLDTVLQAAHIAISGSLLESDSDAILSSIVEALKGGIESQRLQRTPHLVLLDPDFYAEKLKALLADRALSFMKARHIFDGMGEILPSTSLLTEYVLHGNSASAPTAQAVRDMEGEHGEAIQALNLAHDWVSSYAPHVLRKVDRVSFGLLQPADKDTLGTQQPLSRRLLGIPFVGKDVPSAAAEFAQPDVLIGATILAYRYEGLRQGDMKTIIKLLKESMHLESGPKAQRRSYIKYEGWVQAACRSQGLTVRPVLDLELLQIGDEKQMGSLFALLRNERDVIHHYLSKVVFPRCMHQQRLKISSSGQELGSDILFGRRLGFSGTPSNLLPVDLVPCVFEKGSEGKILRSLTDEDVTREAEISKALERPGTEGWTVKGVLDQIAQSKDPPFRALIDTGALITGYSNEEVARYLVDNGLEHLQGCVFLDHLDRKMIYIRGAARCIPLGECGLGRGERFTFYDQVHTTGMDIKQSLSACAVLTIGKDMTFRDYAQGAYRMRGIGRGQTVHLFIVPEIKRLIRKSLPRLTNHMEDDVAAWLLLNGMKAEKLQFLQLCTQNMQTIWRKEALNNLLSSSGVSIDGFQAPRGVDRFHQGGSSDMLRRSMSALLDVIDFDIPVDVPSSEPFQDTLQRMVDRKSALCTRTRQGEMVKIVMQQTRDAMESSATRESSNAKRGLNSEMTREKEREQEQQKQKQQQQQSESMFSKDSGSQYSWSPRILTSQPKGEEELRAIQSTGRWNSDFPFYYLSMFSPRPKDFEFEGAMDSTVKFERVEPMHFPAEAMQSMNFAALCRDRTKPLRLKNVNVVLDWHVAGEHRLVVVSLAEAEALRCYIQSLNASGMGTVGDDNSFALIILPGNIVLEETSNYRGAEDAALQEGAVCLRFWNNDMFYNNEETSVLLETIGNDPQEARRAFFDSSLAARRRSRKTWSGTPVRKFLSIEGSEEFQQVMEIIGKVQNSLERDQIDILQLCDEYDSDGNGFLDYGEIMDIMGSLEVSVDNADLARIVKLMDIDGDNAVDYGEFVSMFQPDSSHDSNAKRVNNMLDPSRGGGTEAEEREKRLQRRMEAKRIRLERLRKRERQAAAERRRRAEQRRKDENSEEQRRKDREAREREARLREAERARREEMRRRQRQQRQHEGTGEVGVGDIDITIGGGQGSDDDGIGGIYSDLDGYGDSDFGETFDSGSEHGNDDDPFSDAFLARLVRQGRDGDGDGDGDDDDDDDDAGSRSDGDSGSKWKGTTGGSGSGGIAYEEQDLSVSEVISSSQSVNFWALASQFDDTGAVNCCALKCFGVQLLPRGPCFSKFCGPEPLGICQDFGCSGRAALLCCGCIYCCKRDAKPFETSICYGDHSVAMPCCRCGKASCSPTSFDCCYGQQQCCCVVGNCLTNQCVPDSDATQAIPEQGNMGVAFAGYSLSPEKGWWKPVEIIAPQIRDMDRDDEGMYDDDQKLEVSSLCSKDGGINFWNLAPDFDDTGSLLFTGLFCCNATILPRSGCVEKCGQEQHGSLLDDVGCSGTLSLCCFGTKCCLKRGAESYGTNFCVGEHTCTCCCIKCGKSMASPTSCQWMYGQLQCCLCVGTCCTNKCVVDPRDGRRPPDSLGLAVAGRTCSPESGWFKPIEMTR